MKRGAALFDDNRRVPSYPARLQWNVPSKGGGVGGRQDSWWPEEALAGAYAVEGWNRLTFVKYLVSDIGKVRTWEEGNK